MEVEEAEENLPPTPPTNQNNGVGQSGQEKRSSSRVEKKEQLAKVEKMLGSYKLAEEKGDQSILRPSIQSSVTGLRQTLLAVNKATSEIRDILLNESNIIHECKVCLNMFRSTTNFISHKRTYCQLRYHQTRHRDYRECSDNNKEDDGKGDSVDETLATVFIVPEDPVDTLVKVSGCDDDFDLDVWSPSIAIMKEAGIINEIENRPLFTQLKKDQNGIDKIATRLKEKVDAAFDADYYKSKTIRLEQMRQSKNAVFQTVGGMGGPSMGERYSSWQLEKQKPNHFLGPNGKTLDPGETSSLCLSDSSSKENHNLNEKSRGSRKLIFKSRCFKCNRYFVEKSSLKRHLIKNHDLDSGQALEAVRTAKQKKFSVQVDGYGKIVGKFTKIPGSPVKSLICGTSTAQRIRNEDYIHEGILKPCTVDVFRLTEAQIDDWTSPKAPSDPFVSKRSLMKKRLSPKKVEEAIHRSDSVNSDIEKTLTISSEDHASIALKRVTVQLSPLSPEIAKLATPEKQKQLAQSRLSTTCALNPIDLNIDQDKPSNHKSPVKDIIHDTDNLAMASLANRKRRRSSYNEDEDGEDEIVFNYRAAIKRPQTEELTSQEVDAAPSSRSIRATSPEPTVVKRALTMSPERALKRISCDLKNESPNVVTSRDRHRQAIAKDSGDSTNKESQSQNSSGETSEEAKRNENVENMETSSKCDKNGSDEKIDAVTAMANYTKNGEEGRTSSTKSNHEKYNGDSSQQEDSITAESAEGASRSKQSTSGDSKESRAKRCSSLETSVTQPNRGSTAMSKDSGSERSESSQPNDTRPKRSLSMEPKDLKSKRHQEVSAEDNMRGTKLNLEQQIRKHSRASGGDLKITDYFSKPKDPGPATESSEHASMPKQNTLGNSKESRAKRSPSLETDHSRSSRSPSVESKNSGSDRSLSVEPKDSRSKRSPSTEPTDSESKKSPNVEPTKPLRSKRSPSMEPKKSERSPSVDRATRATRNSTEPNTKNKELKNLFSWTMKSKE